MSLDLPLVNKVIHLVSSLVDPTLPLESEFKVVESMFPPPNPTLSSESFGIEVVPSTQYLSCPSLLIESENHPTEVFIVSSDYSMQEEILSLSTKPSPSTEVISFDWSNLTESLLHSSVPFQIVVNVTTRWMLRTIVDEGNSLVFYPQLLGKI